MTTQVSTPPQVLKCRSTADFLAALPLLVGFNASNSVFVVLFEGKLAGRSIRLDLPPDDSPASTAPLLDFICDALRALSHPEPLSLAVVITTDESFRALGKAPRSQLAGRLERRLRRDGFPPRELCCLASDGWISYLDPRSPLLGHSLSEISGSSIGRAHSQKRQKLSSLDELGAVPDPDPARAAAVAKGLSQLPAHTSPPLDRAAFASRCADPRSEGTAPVAPSSSFTTPSWLADVTTVAQALMRAKKRLSTANTVRLVRAAEHPIRWFVLALSVLTRPEFPIEIVRESSSDLFAGIPLDPESASKMSPPGISVFGMLREAGAEFTEHARLEPLREVLRTAVSETPTELRPVMYALSSWVWWLSGNQTVAHQHIREALSLAPEVELVSMVEHLVQAPLPVQRFAPQSAAA